MVGTGRKNTLNLTMRFCAGFLGPVSLVLPTFTLGGGFAVTVGLPYIYRITRGNEVLFHGRDEDFMLKFESASERVEKCKVRSCTTTNETTFPSISSSSLSCKMLV